jgi:zinc transporter
MPQTTHASATGARLATTTKPLTPGAVYAYLLDRQGGGREISWQNVRKWRPEEGVLWLVGRPSGEETQRWLRLESGLEAEIATLLLRADNRPQCLSYREEGLFLSLRGGGLSPGQHSGEMMCVNIWVDAQRVIVLRPLATQAFSGIRDNIKKRQGPKDSGELLTEVIEGLLLRVEQILFGIDREVDEMEDSLLMDPNVDLQQDLTSLRHKVIHLRRHLVPQNEAITALQRERTSWITLEHRQSLREAAARLHQYLSDLDSSRERAVLIQDEINNHQTRKLNETMKIVAVFTAYLLPMNAITSLLGTNVEGIPGQAGSGPPWGFAIEVTGLLGVLLVSYIIFKKKKWFD